eukprot:CAMPEP_0202871830 /NCGR_PEP_ID=MMETSP1391-20130828/19793_1 /ASSEMBLY_ACC=CAM_ASM_000867 /TAXON_ID=1034604 /ORGANISM="Chlamydomonas leiostraca, Strain SAG 11-49" /LENGTH=664 /DNA_ID=CAMNT_0049552733 /DNA_START=53 /DNA_END=2047 /DNA_ORIENTATION=+
MAGLDGRELVVHQPSVLDDLGEEVTGIIAPVSLCMAVTVLLVRLLNPDGASSSGSSIVIASIAYDENAGDSSGKKFSGALLNALIFAGIMAAMTFVLVLLFKYGCYKVIYAYMAFAVFDIFFLITGVVMAEVITVLDIHIDAFSFMYMLFNFSIVGTIGVLFMPIPLLAKQGYMVWVGILTAYIFTKIPEWTAWVLIAVMAVYDILAVLVPGGPLKMLVEVAIERQQALPALVYEARPARGPYQGSDAWVRRAAQNQGQEGADAESGQGAMGAPGTQAMSAMPPNMTTLAADSRDSSGPGSAAALLPSSTHQPSSALPAAVGPHTRGPLGESSATDVGRPASAGSTASMSQRKGSHGPHMAGPVLGGGSAQVMPTPVPRSVHGSGGGTDSLRGRAQGSRLGERMSPDDQEMTEAGAWVSSPGGHKGQRPGPVGEGVDPEPSPAAHWHPLPGGPDAGRTSNTLSTARTASGTLRGASSSGPLSPDHPMSQALLPGDHSDTRVGGEQHGHLAPGELPHRVSHPGTQLPVLAHLPGAHGTLDDVPPAHLGIGSGRLQPAGPGQPQQQQDQADGEEIELPDSIKLGLGDFIFYSMMVGRAAMYDFMTVFACYLGIIAGLGLTLLCLAFYQRALPALPFSIALGMLFYFLTRLALEPFLVPLATQLVYF